MSVAAEPTRWLLISLSTGGSSTLRVHAWRRLRSLGALYLQNSVCLLPERPETQRLVKRLAHRVAEGGGEAQALSIAILDPEQEASTIERFRLEREDEYREVCSRAPAFLEEIKMERSRGRATYTEVEESEADLARLRIWLGRIVARDYFDAEGRVEAEAILEACGEALSRFEAEALDAEQPGDAEGAPKRSSPDD